MGIRPMTRGEQEARDMVRAFVGRRITGPALDEEGTHVVGFTLSRNPAVEQHDLVMQIQRPLPVTTQLLDDMQTRFQGRRLAALNFAVSGIVLEPEEGGDALQIKL